jgi:CHAT domain-containing protein
MTVTRRRATNFISLVLLGCLLTSSPVLSKDQGDEHANVWRVVEQFFAAFAQKDAGKLLALWNVKSPEFPKNRGITLHTFAVNSAIEVKSLRQDKVAVEKDRATVQLTAELILTSTQPNSSPTPWQSRRTIELINEAGVWKIWKHTTAEEELAAAISAVQTRAEADALLKAQPALATPHFIVALTISTMELQARGKHDQASLIGDLALHTAQRINDKHGVFMTLREKGDSARIRGNYQQALDYLNQSLQLAEELGDKLSIANALNSIGIVYGAQSDLPNALIVFRRSLQIKEEIGDKTDIARELGNIGNIYLAQGEKVRALEHFQRSLKLAAELGNKGGVSATLNSIGALYHGQGNYAQALEYYERSQKIKAEIGDQLGVARALFNIGMIHAVRGQYAEALDSLQRNEKIRQEVGDKAGEVEALHGIGTVYLLKGDYTQALTYEQDALKRAEALANNELMAEVLQNISDTYLRLGQNQLASEYAERAAGLAVRLGIPEILWKARHLAGKAQLALNQPELAQKNFLESIATIENMRTRVAGGASEKQRFFENKIAPYQAMVQLSLAQGKRAEALSYAERAKGRVLLDVLNSGRDDVTKGMTNEEIKRDRALSAQIALFNTQLARLKVQGKPAEAQAAEVQTKLDKTRLEYEAFQATLYVAHPDLKMQRGQTEMISFSETALLLRDQGTVVLEYVVTEDRTYLFVLQTATPRDMTGMKKGAVTNVTVHTINIKSAELATLAEAFRQKLAERDLTIKQPAGRLYDLLIKPAEEQLRGARKLCIVPDGALWNVPFQALHQSERGYLLEQFAISYAPSLSVLREMGKKANALKITQQRSTPRFTRVRAVPENARPELLALGNPALNDETVAEARITHRDERLGPLPDAEKEVNSLRRLYGASNSRVLIGEDARESIVKTDAGKYDILHFATHATLDDRNPLYSRIVLSRAEDEAHEDGLLEAWEIMKLDLNAALTVLSACETARGRVAAGEGMIGISWALFVAGSPAAVVSQWKVDSARTSELMIEFHQNLLRKRAAGPAPSKSEALRQAALKLMRGPYNHPTYWAGFILIGDDN